MKLFLSNFKIDKFLSGDRRVIFLFGNDQTAQKKMVDIILAAARLKPEYQGIQCLSSGPKSFDFSNLSEESLFADYQQKKLFVIEKVGDAFLSKLEKILGSNHLFILVTDGYRFSKKIGEYLSGNTDCDCIGMFSKDSNINNSNLTKIMCTTFFHHSSAITQNVFKAVQQRLALDDANIVSLAFEIDVLQGLAFKDSDIKNTNKGRRLDIISKLEPVSAIRFFLGGASKNITEPSDVETVKKLWALEKKIKQSAHIDNVLFKEMIFQSLPLE